MSLTKEFHDDLVTVLHKHNIDSETMTPSFILAQHLCVLIMGAQALNQDRDKWFGFNPYSKEDTAGQDTENPIDPNTLIPPKG